MEQHQNYHYVHLREHPHSQRSICKSLQIYEHAQHKQFSAIVNHNTVQLYEKIGSSLVYSTTHHFMCDITVMEVIVVKGEASDVLFLADQLGRFLFWQPVRGPLSVNNTIRSPEYLAPFYQKVPAQEKQRQFSGCFSSHNSLDTETILFFTAQTKIIFLRVRFSKEKIHFPSPPIQITCPYLDVNFIGLVGGKDPWLGIIEQREQKTYLRFHRINSQNFQCTYSIQKPNLSSFYVNPQGDELITTTNSELTIYNIKNLQVFCTFQISQPGFINALSSDLFLYIGQLGSQMIVFSKKHYKNYGSFMLENQVCMKVSTHGKLTDGGYLVSVIDQGHTVEFISLFEDSWRSLKSIFSTTFIFSIEDLNKTNQCLAVVRMSDNIHQVGILSKKTPTKLQKQTLFRTPILAIFSTNNGKGIILSTSETNSVFTYDKINCTFQLAFDFLPGVIINVIEEFVVMENKIYRMDLNANTINQLWQQNNGIVSAHFDGRFIGFQCGDFSYKFFNTETNKIDRIRKNCHEQYICKFHCSQTLLVASLNCPGKLKVIPVFKQAYVVEIECLEMVADILSHGELVIVTFVNGKIEVYEFMRMKKVYEFEGVSEPLGLIQAGQNVLVYGNNQAYLLKFNQVNLKISIQQIQFDPSKQCAQIAYLNTSNSFVVSHQNSLCLYSVRGSKEQSSCFRILSMNIGVNGDTNPPFATANNNTLYIAYCYEIIMRNIHTAELIRKQSHGLKQILAIEKIDMGLLVCGIDDMENTQLFLFSYVDLQIIFTECLLKKKISAIKQKQHNTFFMREQQKLLSLFELKPQLTLKQILTSKTSLSGYTLSVQPQLEMLLVSDPLRYLVVYDYRLGKLVSLCRYHNVNTIVDVQFLQNSIVLGDVAGSLSIVEFNLDKGEIARGTLTQVSSIKVGSEILQTVKGKEGVLYSTISGSIGRVITISSSNFILLKQIQKFTLACLEQNQNQLRYQQWVNRTTLNDKLIDGFLIDLYLKTNEMKDTRYEEVETIWNSLIHKK